MWSSREGQCEEELKEPSTVAQCLSTENPHVKLWCFSVLFFPKDGVPTLRTLIFRAANPRRSPAHQKLQPTRRAQANVVERHVRQQTSLKDPVVGAKRKLHRVLRKPSAFGLPSKFEMAPLGAHLFGRNGPFGRLGCLLTGVKKNMKGVKLRKTRDRLNYMLYKACVFRNLLLAEQNKVHIAKMLPCFQQSVCIQGLRQRDAVTLVSSLSWSCRERRLSSGHPQPSLSGTCVPWVSCLDPPVCHRVQDDPVAKSQPSVVLS